MKPLKIIGTFLLVLAMTLGTVACAKTEIPQNSEPAAAPVTQSQPEQPVEQEQHRDVKDGPAHRAENKRRLPVPHPLENVDNKET